MKVKTKWVLMGETSDSGSVTGLAYVVILFLLLVPVASISGAPLAFEQAFFDANLVAHVTVTRVENEVYAEGSRKMSCGTNYIAKAREIFKGDRLDIISIASFGLPTAYPFLNIKVGDSLFVMLSRRPADEDIMINKIPDVVVLTPSPKRQECVVRLGSYHSASTEGIFFIEKEEDKTSNSVSDWMLYTNTFSSMPADLAAFDRPYDSDCKKSACVKDPRRRIPWDLVRERMRSWSK